MGKHTELIAYKKAFSLAMEIFSISRSFPKEETYSLTDQIRRSSRSVCSAIAESYSKRQYPKHFVAKLTDADMENNETQTWLEFANACNYLDTEINSELTRKSEEIKRLLNYMINHPQKFS